MSERVACVNHPSERVKLPPEVCLADPRFLWNCKPSAQYHAAGSDSPALDREHTGMPKADVIGIHVRITINAKNGLRRVNFDLKKATEGDEVSWAIQFQLFERERKLDPYIDALVDVSVEVEQKLHKQAEAIARNQALSPGQAAYAIGPAADDAKAAEEGAIPQGDANEAIQTTLRKK
jgi:hypothetical protein